MNLLFKAFVISVVVSGEFEGDSYVFVLRRSFVRELFDGFPECVL